MILRKIIKIAATRCHILKLKCIKFDFGWGSGAGAYSAPPDRLVGFKGPTSKGRGRGEGRGRGPEGRGKGEGIWGRGGRGRRMGIAHPLFSA